MWLLWLAAVFALCATTSAQTDLTQFVGNLPKCAIGCLFQSLTESKCSLQDSDCVCTDPDLTAATTICLTQNCTIIESLQVANITDVACGHATGGNRTSHLKGTAALGFVALLAVCLRLVARWVIEGDLKKDDYIMVIVLLLLVPFVILGVLSAVYGFGKDIWAIKPDNIVKALKFFFFNQIIYITLLALCKISMLLFYLCIFPSRHFRLTCLAVITWVVVTMVLFQLLVLFQCTPISTNWKGWKNFQEMSDKCFDISALAYSSAIINIIQDFAVLLLPLPWLIRLKVNLKRKISVLLIFSIGIFICIVSIVRVVFLFKYRATRNPTRDFIDPIFWTAIEVYVSIIVPSLPSIRALLAQKFKIFNLDTTIDNSGRRYYQQSSRNAPPKHLAASNYVTTGRGDHENRASSIASSAHLDPIPKVGGFNRVDSVNSVDALVEEGTELRTRKG